MITNLANQLTSLFLLRKFTKNEKTLRKPKRMKKHSKTLKNEKTLKKLQKIKKTPKNHGKTWKNKKNENLNNFSWSISTEEEANTTTLTALTAKTAIKMKAWPNCAKRSRRRSQKSARKTGKPTSGSWRQTSKRSLVGRSLMRAKRFSAPKLLRVFLVILGRPLQNDWCSTGSSWMI